MLKTAIIGCGEEADSFFNAAYPQVFETCQADFIKKRQVPELIPGNDQAVNPPASRLAGAVIVLQLRGKSDRFLQQLAIKVLPFQGPRQKKVSFVNSRQRNQHIFFQSEYTTPLALLLPSGPTKTSTGSAPGKSRQWSLRREYHRLLGNRGSTGYPKAIARHNDNRCRMIFPATGYCRLLTAIGISFQKKSYKS